MSEDELGFDLPPPAKGSRIAVLVAVVALAGGAFAFGFLRRGSHADPIAPHETEITRVSVTTPKVLESDRALALPGVVRPLEETQLFARVTGYLRAWKVDRGDKVIAGQVLAEIDTPDLDAQLVQGRAQLAAAQAAVAQAVAQRDYSKSNSARVGTLADQQLVAKAAVEQSRAQAATDEATVNAARSNVAAQEANVRRLVELQGFAKVVAPFAGTVTLRSVDRGALVREGATLMFTLVATDPVRIFIDAPQSIAPHVQPGNDAAITVGEYAGRTFAGKVTRSSGVLDPDVHTMTTEVQVPNTDGALMPGMYVQVAIKLPVPHRVVEIPSTALYSDAQGLRVATVDRGGIVKLVKIAIERDTGATLQIATGLTGEEQIIETAVPWLVDGDRVEIAAKKPPPAGSAK